MDTFEAADDGITVEGEVATLVDGDMTAVPTTRGGLDGQTGHTERTVELRRGGPRGPGPLRALPGSAAALYPPAHGRGARGRPVMRGMFHEFPADWACRDPADQYMFGPGLPVAPVVEAEATARRVYLQAGAAWTDLHTGAEQEGGRWIITETPLDRVPVYTRDGALHELVGSV